MKDLPGIEEPEKFKERETHYYQAQELVGSHLRVLSLRGDMFKGTFWEVNLTAACWLHWKGESWK